MVPREGFAISTMVELILHNENIRETIKLPLQMVTQFLLQIKHMELHMNTEKMKCVTFYTF